jgi:hypothetical protein
MDDSKILSELNGRRSEGYPPHPYPSPPKSGWRGRRRTAQMGPCHTVLGISGFGYFRFLEELEERWAGIELSKYTVYIYTNSACNFCFHIVNCLSEALLSEVEAHFSEVKIFWKRVTHHV